MINQIQKLQFELMKFSSFNSFVGEKVVSDLEKHEDLWKGVVMDREFLDRSTEINQWVGGCDLLKLRDIPDGYWSVDTLFITPIEGKENELELLARTWEADEVDWIGGEEACKLIGSYSPEGRAKKKTILRVWWD